MDDQDGARAVFRDRDANDQTDAEHAAWSRAGHAFRDGSDRGDDAALDDRVGAEADRDENLDDLFDDLYARPEGAVSLTDDGWVWRDSREPLSFDECEELGLDGTLRDT